MRVAGIVRMLSRMMGVVLLVVAALAVSAASVVGRAILGARMVRAIAAYAAYTGRASVTALEIVPGASHLFEEPGALEQVARLAGDWFARHLAGVSWLTAGAGFGVFESIFRMGL
jgi:hypothetical protein